MALIKNKEQNDYMRGLKLIYLLWLYTDLNFRTLELYIYNLRNFVILLISFLFDKYEKNAFYNIFLMNKS